MKNKKISHCWNSSEIQSRKGGHRGRDRMVL